MGRYNTKSPTEPFLFKVLEVGLRLNPINIQPLKYIKKLDLKGKDCPHVITPKPAALDMPSMCISLKASQMVTRITQEHSR